ncbi:hypothetical protein HK098_000211 [Nowakowskiella sp. JEL0407]|nr:hypothetical protein HK098_000211 [Nowakowskiella sp. JEL0407]
MGIMVRAILKGVRPAAIELKVPSEMSSATSIQVKTETTIRKVGSQSLLVPEMASSIGFSTEDSEESFDVTASFEAVNGGRWLKPKAANGELTSYFFVYLDNETFNEVGSGSTPNAVAGDVLEITAITEDGSWGLGRNLRTMVVGTFQMSALRKVSESDARRRRVKHIRTNSGNTSNTSTAAGEPSPVDTHSSFGRGFKSSSLSRNLQPDYQTNLLITRLSAGTNLQRSSSLSARHHNNANLAINTDSTAERTHTVEEQSPKPIHTKFTVIIPYTKQRHDEINLFESNIIQVNHIFEDTWAEGYNISTNEFGIFPLTYCVEKVDVQPASVTKPAASNLPKYFSESDSQIDGNVSSNEFENGHQTSPTSLQDHIQDSSNYKTVMPLMALYGAASEDIIVSSTPSQNDTNIPEFVATESSCRYDYEQSYAQPHNEMIVTVIKSYEPTREDELKLYVGQKIALIQEYKDGWAFGKDLGSGNQGVFPIEFTTRDG